MHQTTCRLLVCGLFIALLPLLEIAAQTRTPPTIPNTPAGSALRAYIDATSTLDTTRLRTFVKRYRPDVQLDMSRELLFAERTGGFDLVGIEQSEANHVEFTTRERNSGMTAYGVIDVSDSVEPVITMFRLLLGVTREAVRVDTLVRSQLIARVGSALDSAYVFHDVGTRMRDSLHARLARGEYDRDTTGFAFAHRVTRDLVGISHDKHIAVEYRPSPTTLPPGGAAPQPRPSPAPTPSSVPRPAPAPGPSPDQRVCGFERDERLDGDIAYLKINVFADLARCESNAIAAMDSLATARALIIDLRDNLGGSPQMISLVASYVFDHRTHLNDFFERASGRTAESWTQDSVRGRRFGGSKPVYILTSSRTFSGGEEFSYDLQAQKRAVIVGQATGGGAHLVSPRRIDEHFTLSLPFARAINPITHANWEGVGVEPDIKTPAEDALATALKRLRDRSRD